MTSTPILFLIFIRPDTTQVVFDAIKKHRPKYLYVAADGPREGNEKDERLCRESRAIIDQVDWECEVKTLFRDKNLGCKLGVSSAINWFFENVEAGIILEDDCVPHQSFFRFASEMLEKYKDEEKVMMITGTNYFFGKKIYKESYGFSRHYAIWGWATWRRAWQQYDVEMKSYSPTSATTKLKETYHQRKIVRYYLYLFNLVREGQLNTWDIQWVYTCIMHNGLCIVPAFNLISNIGSEGNHTQTLGPFHAMQTYALDLTKITHPAQAEDDIRADAIIYNKIVKPYVITKLINALHRIRRWI